MVYDGHKDEKSGQRETGAQAGRRKKPSWSGAVVAAIFVETVTVAVIATEAASTHHLPPSAAVSIGTHYLPPTSAVVLAATAAHPTAAAARRTTVYPGPESLGA